MTTLPAIGDAIEGEIIAPGADFTFSPSPFKSEAHRVSMPEGATVADAVAIACARFNLHGRLRDHIGVYIGDHRIPDANWARVRPKRGSDLYIRLEVRGGGRGKNPLRSILMLVVAVAAIAFAPHLSWLVAQGAVGMGLPLGVANAIGSVTLMTAGLLTAGAYLVNALVPPPQLSRASDPFGFDQQPGNPYAQLTGLRNQAAPYGRIPRIVGERRLYPMLAARPYTESQGNAQYLRLLLLVGYGPLDISDIRIGNTPISAFPGAEVEIREGWSTDTAVTLFTKNIGEEQLSVLLNPSTANTRTTHTNTREVSVDVTWPSGLFSVDSQGNRLNRSVTCTVEYRANGSGGAWSNAVWIDGSSNYGTAVNGQITATASSAEAVIRSGRFLVPSAGTWDIRVTRTTSAGGSSDFDAAYWTVLRSIRADAPVNHPGLALIALRLKATAQLNGAPDTINCLAKSYLPVWDGSAWNWEISSNPAWSYADMFRRRGLKTVIGDHRLDLTRIKAWADACDATAPNAAEPYFRCSAVLEGGSIYSAASTIAAHGRAQFALIDGKYSTVRDVEQATPVQHITPRNSSGYRGAKAFLDVPHALRMTWINPDKNYAQDVVIVYRDGYNDDGSGGNIAATKFDTIDLPACTSATQAWREGRYHLAVMLLRPEEHSVSMDMEGAVRLNKGDLVRFSDDVVGIGLESGRLRDIAEDGGDHVTGVVLDCPVNMEAGKRYALRIRHLDGTASLHNITPQIGEDIVELGFEGSVPVSGGPAPGDLFTFGEVDLETAPMIIKEIARGEGMSARLTLVDAQAGVYTADRGTIPAFNTYITAGLPESQLRPSAPTISLRSDETALLRLTDGTLLDQIIVTLAPSSAGAQMMQRWDIEAKRNGSGADEWRPYFKDHPIEAGSVPIAGVVGGQAWDVRARVISVFGLASDWTEIANHTVVGKTTAPNPISGLAIDSTLDGVVLTWTNSSSPDVIGYEVRYGGANWNAAASLGLVSGPVALFKFALSGVTTFRVKALDSVGLYSTEVTISSPAANSTGFLGVGVPAYAGNSGALSGGLTAGQSFIDLSDGNKLKTVVAPVSSSGAKFSETIDIDSDGTNWVIAARCAFADVATGGRLSFFFGITADAGTSLTSGTNFDGEYQIFETTTGGTAPGTVLRSGTFDVDDVLGTMVATPDVADTGIWYPPQSAGARDYVLRFRRASGANNANDFNMSLLTIYIPPA